MVTNEPRTNNGERDYQNKQVATVCRRDAEDVEGQESAAMLAMRQCAIIAGKRVITYSKCAKQKRGVKHGENELRLLVVIGSLCHYDVVGHKPQPGLQRECETGAAAAFLGKIGG